VGEGDGTYRMQKGPRPRLSALTQNLEMGSLEHGESAIRVDDGLVSSAHLSDGHADVRV
jgi:hypothetical protein